MNNSIFNSFKFNKSIFSYLFSFLFVNICFAQSNYGGLDLTFNPSDLGFQKNHGITSSSNGLLGGINDFQFSPDGKFYICGGYNNYSGYSATQISRLNADLSYDNSFQWNIGSPVSWTSGKVCFGLQNNGNLVIGGNFLGSSQYTKRICGLQSTGSLNSSFFVGNNAATAGTNDEVLDILPLSSGKVIVAGKFSSFAGSATNHIFRAGVNGGKDATFNVGLGITSSFISSYITKVETTSTGKLLVIGTFTSWNNLSYNGIVRLQENGVLDSSFSIGSGPNGTVNSIHELANGKIVIGGNFTSFNNVSCNNICLLNADGSVDLSFVSGSGLNGEPYTISSDAIGQILIGGLFSSYNGNIKQNFVALNQNGSIGSGYQGIFNGRVSSIKTHTDGNVYFSGLFTAVNGHGINSFGRFDSAGNLDSLFNRSTGVNFVLKSVDQVESNKLIVAGNHSAYNGVYIPSSFHFIDTIGNYIPSALDSFSDLGGVNLAMVNLNNYILVGGSTPIPLAPSQQILYRFNQNGQLDPSFQCALPATINDQLIDLELLSNGKYYALYQSTNTFYIQRMNSNGSIDPTFALVTINTGAYNIEIVENDRVLVTGHNMSVNGSSSSSVVKINEDGTLDNLFSSGVGPNNICRNALVLNNGNYLIGGNFTTWSGIPQKGYIVLSKNTGLPVNDFQYTVNYSIDQQINSCELLPNGKIILYGIFQNTTTDYTSSVVLFPNGLRDNNYQGYKVNNIEFIGLINSTIQLPSGAFILAGQYSSIQNEGANCISKVKYSYLPIQYDTVYACDSYVGQNGLTYTTTTDSIYYSFVSSNGADSLVMYKAFVYPTTYSNIQLYACQSYTWPITNDTYVNSGNYVGYTINSNGCDSIITLNLTIVPIFNDTFTVSSCGSYFWNVSNQIYSTSGFYSDTLINQYGCDSILTIDLTIYPLFSDTLNIQACNSFTWTNGVTYYQSGIYSDTLTSINGCDSILNIDLTFLQSNSNLNVSNCNSYTWPINNQTYTVSGQYIDTIQNAAGCDSIITLNLTILNSNSGIDIRTACDSLTWLDGNTYSTSTNTPTFTIPNAAGCDSIITLDLTIIPSLPLTISNSFSLPSDATTCVGELAVSVSGNADFELNVDNGAQIVNTSGYSLINNLCPGVHDLLVTDNCGDSLTTQFVIPIDSNYVFNNPFIDSIAVDSLGTTITNCDIYYNQIDTAYIDSIWANGNTVNVIWNIVDSNGSNLDTSSYVLNNGNGVYWLQLSVFCPTKALGDYFTVTEAIYFNNGTISTADLVENTFQFELYPNPTNNEVTLTFDSNEAQVFIYDTQGKLIQTKSIHSGEQVSLKEVETGVYFFEVTTEKGRVVKRVVKN